MDHYPDTPNLDYRYDYNVHGSMTTMPHLGTMEWDFTEHLHHIARTTGTQGDGDGCPDASLEAWYCYDAAKQRTRKRVVKQGGMVEERLYLGELEIFRKFDTGGTLTLERETLHVMNHQQRIAMVETRRHGDEPGLPEQLVQYQFGSHLGSVSLELDAAAQIISYEEYYPYGSTSYQAVSSQTETPKRYRYTGMERDEETGLNYHGARYYATWLGRWCSCDPTSLRSGLNLYRFVRNKPIKKIDPNGMDDCDPLTQSCIPSPLDDFEELLEEEHQDLMDELQQCFAIEDVPEVVAQREEETARRRQASRRRVETESSSPRPGTVRGSTGSVAHVGAASRRLITTASSLPRRITGRIVVGTALTLSPSAASELQTTTDPSELRPPARTAVLDPLEGSPSGSPPHGPRRGDLAPLRGPGYRGTYRVQDIPRLLHGSSGPPGVQPVQPMPWMSEQEFQAFRQRYTRTGTLPPPNIPQARPNPAETPSATVRPRSAPRGTPRSGGGSGSLGGAASALSVVGMVWQAFIWSHTSERYGYIDVGWIRMATDSRGYSHGALRPRYDPDRI